MAAEIKPISPSMSRRNSFKKPVLVSKIEGYDDDVNDAVILPGEDGVIAASDDRSVRVWLRRDSGQYWPSICHYLPSPASALYYDKESRSVFVGQDNGTVSEFVLAADYNALTHSRDYLSHHGRVTQVVYSSSFKWILSVSKDKYFQYFCTETGSRQGGFLCQAPCLALRFDADSKHAFVGDSSGQVSMIRLDPKPGVDNLAEICGVQLVTVLKGHSGPVNALVWDAEKSLLFSGSDDQSIVAWDIGGQQGTVYELQGHRNKVKALCFAAAGKHLISGAEDSIFGVWNMNIKRLEVPAWTENDSCQQCNRPFFWNLRAMLDQKQLGLRQHHCRKCGKAVCDKCSPHRSTFPLMGYEYDVRMCAPCFHSITEADRNPLALFQEAKHNIMGLDWDESRYHLLTLGQDRVLKLWDLSAVVKH